MNYFSDIAIKQSDEAGASIDRLAALNMMWFLLKWNIDILRFPELNEKVIVRTWGFSMVKFHAYRQFEILDGKGDRIVAADSVWLLIDLARRKPIRITDDMFDFYRIDRNNENILDVEKLKVPDRTEFEKNFSVRLADIDMNRHVNNVKYAEWALETVPMDIIERYRMKNIVVSYEKETDYGNDVISASEKLDVDDSMVFNHRISNSRDETLALLRTSWERTNT